MGSVNMASRDKDSILDQLYDRQICSDLSFISLKSYMFLIKIQKLLLFIYFNAILRTTKTVPF